MQQKRSFVCVTTADLFVRVAYQIGKTPLLPIFAASLGATGAFLGVIVSVSTLTGMLLKPLIGALSDRWGRRIWLLIGTIFFTVMPFFYHFVHTPQQLFVVRLVHGLSTAIYGPVTVALVAEQPSNRRAERLGWFSMARSAGYILGPSIAGGLLLIIDPVHVFTIIGMLSSAAFFPIVRLPNHVSLGKNSKFSLFQQLFQSLKTNSCKSSIWLSGSLNAVNFIALYAIKAFLPVHAMTSGLNIALVGIFFSIQEFIHMLLKPLGGRIGDRLGYLNTIILGMLLLGGLLPLVTYTQTGITLILLSICMGMAQALIFPSTIALIATQIPANSLGAGIGIVGTFNNAGKVIGPILSGFLIELFSFSFAIHTIGFMLVLSAGIVFLSQQSSRQRSKIIDGQCHGPFK